MICIRNLQFQSITKKALTKINLSDIKFFIVLRSGLVYKPGNTYIFTSNGAFFINNTTDDFLSTIIPQTWNKINLYFCDDLIINPKIYNSFIHKLCTKNIRDFWFETAIDIFKNRIQK